MSDKPINIRVVGVPDQASQAIKVIEELERLYNLRIDDYGRRDRFCDWIEECQMVLEGTFHIEQVDPPDESNGFAGTYRVKGAG